MKGDLITRVDIQVIRGTSGGAGRQFGMGVGVGVGGGGEEEEEDDSGVIKRCS